MDRWCRRTDHCAYTPQLGHTRFLLVPNWGFSSVWHKQYLLLSQASTRELEESSPSLLSSWPGALSGSSEWDLHPRISVVQLIYLSKRICRAQFLPFDPRATQPCPIVHTFYSFAKKMAIFLHWRDKTKNSVPETKVNFSNFFLPLFVMLAPSQFTVFYFLSSVCVNFYINFFFFCTAPEEKDFSALTSCPLLRTFECSLLKASYLYTGTKHIPLTPCGITPHADC